MILQTTYIRTFSKLADFSPLIPAQPRQSYDLDWFKIWKCPQNKNQSEKNPINQMLAKSYEMWWMGQSSGIRRNCVHKSVFWLANSHKQASQICTVSQRLARTWIAMFYWDSQINSWSVTVDQSNSCFVHQRRGEEGGRKDVKSIFMNHGIISSLKSFNKKDFSIKGFWYNNKIKFSTTLWMTICWLWHQNWFT